MTGYQSLASLLYAEDANEHTFRNIPCKDGTEMESMLRCLVIVFPYFDTSHPVAWDEESHRFFEEKIQGWSEG
jgi:hypothetical protein